MGKVHKEKTQALQPARRGMTCGIRLPVGKADLDLDMWGSVVCATRDPEWH
jgi:hypothetical protein